MSFLKRHHVFNKEQQKKEPLWKRILHILNPKQEEEPKETDAEKQRKYKLALRGWKKVKNIVI